MRTRLAVLHLALLLLPLSMKTAAQASPDVVAHDVTIYRDHWGTPHVFGKTDASTIFGFAYAQAEDNFPQLEEDFILAIGRGAEIHANTSRRNVIVAEVLQLEITQAGNCRVTKRARRKGAISLDERHRQAWVGALERTRAGCTAKSTAHHDHARIAVLGDGGHWENGGRSRHCSSDEVASSYAILSHRRISW